MIIIAFYRKLWHLPHGKSRKWQIKTVSHSTGVESDVVDDADHDGNNDDDENILNTHNLNEFCTAKIDAAYPGKCFR